MRALSLLLVLVALPAAAKPLYITVPRAYGSSERIVVDVAFAQKEPVELRVLAPADAGAFVQGQANLRRAYETPPTTLNPGRYLARGLNAVHSPGYFLLRALDEPYRKAIAPALPPWPAPQAGELQRLPEGPAKLVGVPPGMTVVRRSWLNLDLGGKEREFHVPGYEEWWEGAEFEQRRLELDPLPTGLYVLQLVQGRVEGQVILSVSDLAVQVKQTDGELLVRVAGRDQQARAGAAVRVFVPAAEGPRGETDAQGEVRLTLDAPKVLVMVTLERDVAVVDTDFYSTLAIAPDVFLYTDRPIYRPGDEARFRGLVRRPDSFLARLFQPKRPEVKVRLLPQEGAEVVTRARVDEFGAFTGVLKVPEGLDTGVLRLVAEVDGGEHAAEARVQQYVKPTFYVELTSEQDSVTPGETLRAKVGARRYAGGVPPGAAYEVFLYRTVLESPTWVDDAGLGGQGSAVTYGSAATTEGGLSVPKRLFSSVNERAQKNDEVAADPWASAAKLDANGEADVVVQVPPLAPEEQRLSFKYVLTVRARDDQGTFANASRPYFVGATEVMGTLRPSAKLVLTGAVAELAVRATTLAGRAFGPADGSLKLRLREADGDERALAEQSFRTGDDGVWRGALPTADAGTVLAQVELRDARGRPWTGETSMLVAAPGGGAVARVPALTVETVDGALEPGGRARVVALFPERWAADDRGPVWITVEGRGLYATAMATLDGRTLIHELEIEERFGSSVYVSVSYATAAGRWEERTASFRIVPSERLLRVTVAPEKLEAAPLGQQVLRVRVTDHQGRGIPAQLSLGVVDKAVYAIQAEFRPSVLEFFYPLGRNNVATFTSAEFQGYGHGEAFAQLGHLRPYAFAGVKPPTRQAAQKERDTAYWNAAVTTDDTGVARVVFELPSNQTLWTVTAVAADAAGRFGEGTAEFATRGALTVTSALPQFLREGDEARGSVRFSRGEAGGAIREFQAGFQLSGALAEGAAMQAMSLPASDEIALSIPLSAATPGDGVVAISAKNAGEPMADRRVLPVLPAGVEEDVVVSRVGRGALELALAEGATARDVTLLVQPSMVAAAMANLHELLSYPWGCLEQLVATTIPNIAVSQLLAGSPALDPEGKALLAEARSRAVQGVQRILQLALKGGGFTWFHGYDQPSLAMTLIALDGLAHAIDAGLVERADPRIAASLRWLAAAEDVAPELEPVRVWVLARLEGPARAASARALLERADPEDAWASALAVLAADAAKVAAEPALRARVDELARAAADGLAHLDTFPYAQFWSYPLRPVALTAVLVHAASLGAGRDEPALRKRMLDTLGAAGELSTFDRSAFLLHGLWLVKLDARALGKHGEGPKVSAGGAGVRLLPRSGGLGANLDPGVRRVELGDFEGVATLRARVRTPLRSVQAHANGMTLQRSYWVLRESGRTPLADGESVAQGEEVFVELSLDAHVDSAARRSAYYVLEDAVPAGFTPLDEDKEYRGLPHNLPITHEAVRRRSLSPEHVVWFFEEPAAWSGSPRVVGYVMRALFPGKFAAPPARVTDMYAASIGASTSPASLSITPSQQ